MLKLAGQGKDGPVYVLGLARSNVDRLTAGQPIRANLADMGGPNATVVIVFGETERGLFDQLKAGSVLPDGMEYQEGEKEVTRIVRVTPP